jgi:cytochrome c peroxidase
LEPIKQKYPQISYADLWTLAGIVAIESMGGPKIPWQPGYLILFIF